MGMASYWRDVCEPDLFWLAFAIQIILFINILEILGQVPTNYLLLLLDNFLFIQLLQKNKGKKNFCNDLFTKIIPERESRERKNWFWIGRVGGGGGTSLLAAYISVWLLCCKRLTTTPLIHLQCWNYIKMQVHITFWMTILHWSYSWSGSFADIPMK